MIKNKKAIMMKFLVSLVLAIIIFVPACLFTSKFFRLSGQAEDDFIQFTRTIEKAQLTRTTQSHSLIIDSDTFVIGYTGKKNTQLCTSQNACATFAYPPECENEACICLCQEYQGTGFTSSTTQEDIVCQQRTCEKVGNFEFKDRLKLSGFYLTDMPEVFSQGYFRNGFVIARGELEFSGLRFNFQTFRRLPFIIVVDADGKVGLCKELPCQVYEQTP